MSARPRLWLPLSVWAISRGDVLVLWLRVEQVIGGDVAYYWTRMNQHLAQGVSVTDTMPEYPTAVLWLLRIPYAFSGQTFEGFLIAFVVMMVALDLLFTLLLWQRGRGRYAVWFWIAFVVAIGPISYLRLDLIPAVGCGLALVALARRREGAAGGLLAVGAGLKLWPLTLWPTTLRGDKRRDLITSFAFWGSGLAVTLAALLYGGVARLVSPLQWQSGRGLQIESVWALPAMVSRLFAPESYSIVYSRWQAFEIFGPGAEKWLSVATVMTYLGYLAIIAAYLIWILQLYPRLLSWPPSLQSSGSQASLAAVGLFMVVIITITLVTNKTFSPQYLIWLAAPLAALLLVAEDAEVPARLKRTALLTAAWVLVLGGLTQLIYPVLYGALLSGGDQLLLATTVLAVRNLGLLVLAGWLLVRFWPVLRAVGRLTDSRLGGVSGDL